MSHLKLWVMNKILIANRGEIALRVIKTARIMGIKTVAVFSDADRRALHVIEADEAVHIGASPAGESYLQIDKILQAARITKADAIHPGYGFLSENADFARACAKNNIVFIGPPTNAIEVMGSKLAAKEAVKTYDIPMVPGIDYSISDPVKAAKVAEKIGFPILIKASAGGGGKGMRVVEEAENLETQMKRAVSEAQSSFGDGSVFIEKYIESPRHIEIQILADRHGHVIHLYERECSIQRRHQKVIEEAPSCILSEDLRQKMGQAAINVAKACNYEGAGTVEFLLDKNHQFYFLEMNTRLQVEHPVTEMITGLDLVEQQIRIAKGERLTIQQEDVKRSGHAIELRVYAEDPDNNFLPSIGTLTKYRIPSGPGIRVDNGYREGMSIPIYYDPMIAKLVCHGATRSEAIQRLRAAISGYEIAGIKSTLPFGTFVLNHEAFLTGNFDTHFVKNYYSKTVSSESHSDEEKMAALIALRAFRDHKNLLSVPETHLSDWTKRTE